MIGFRQLFPAICVGVLLASSHGAHARDPNEGNRWRGSALIASSGGANFLVVRSSSGWDRMWAPLGRPAPSSFEDGRDLAVMLQTGNRPTAGYTIELLSAEKHGLFLVIRWRERKPAKDAFVAQVVTSPWLIERLAATQKPVLFQKENDRTFVLPRAEYHVFKSSAPKCAANLNVQIDRGEPLVFIDRADLAPLLAEHSACAN